jgi:hypothetical protein
MGFLVCWLVLSCLVLSCLVLSCLVLSCLVLSCLALFCLAFSFLFLSRLVSSRLVSSRLVSCFALSRLVSPCLVSSCLVLSSCLVDFSPLWSVEDIFVEIIFPVLRVCALVECCTYPLPNCKSVQLSPAQETRPSRPYSSDSLNKTRQDETRQVKGDHRRCF